MALRVGIDLISVDSVQDALETHADRYLERVYTDREIADCSSGGELSAERLAARFAAKEATMKALRIRDEAVPWLSIEVRRDAAGWVELRLDGAAAALAEEAGIDDLAVSLTHENGFASAVVVAETRPICR
jgi:holo-[acyl-carrier protein] synthase